MRFGAGIDFIRGKERMHARLDERASIGFFETCHDRTTVDVARRAKN